MRRYSLALLEGPAWDERAHPRDGEGQFAPKGGAVKPKWQRRVERAERAGIAAHRRELKRQLAGNALGSRRARAEARNLNPDALRYIAQQTVRNQVERGALFDRSGELLGFGEGEVDRIRLAVPSKYYATRGGQVIQSDQRRTVSTHLHPGNEPPSALDVRRAYLDREVRVFTPRGRVTRIRAAPALRYGRDESGSERRVRRGIDMEMERVELRMGGVPKPAHVALQSLYRQRKEIGGKGKDPVVDNSIRYYERMRKLKLMERALLEASRKGGGRGGGEKRYPKGTPWQPSGPGPGRFAPEGGGGLGAAGGGRIPGSDSGEGIPPAFRYTDVPRVGYAAKGPGGGFEPVPEGTLSKNRLTVAKTRLMFSEVMRNPDATEDDKAFAYQALKNAELDLAARRQIVGTETRKRRGVIKDRHDAELEAKIRTLQEELDALPSRDRGRAKLQQDIDEWGLVLRASAEDSLEDPNIQRIIGRALVKGEVMKALMTLPRYIAGAALAEAMRRVIIRQMGETQGASILRAGMREGGKFLRTPAGKTVAIGLAALGAAKVIRELMPAARRQTDHSLLVKYDRNSRIQWQKNQEIFGKNGSLASPGQNVLVGHTRRPAVYLGAEWRPQGANPTTTGRLIVQQGKKTRAVKYTDIKAAKSGKAMSPDEAMARARKASESTWQPPATSGKRAFLKHLGRSLEPRIKHEVSTEITALRRGGTRKDKALAYGLERGKSQVFSKSLRRKRRKHTRPMARRNNALKRLASGTSRSGDRQLVAGG